MMRRAAAGLALALAALALHAAGAPQPAAAAPAGPAPAQSAVGYDALRQHVGEHVTVRSRFGSARSGTLLHWSPSEIKLRLDSGAELEMPHDTIRQASLTPAPAAKPKTGPSK